MPDKVVQRVEGMLYREISLREHGTIDEENRTVKISVSSELPILRVPFFSKPWLETLGHKRGEVELERFNNGATLHYNHSRTREDRIGAVVSARIVDKRVEAVVRFSKSDRVNDVWDDVVDGTLTNVSVGYRVNKRVLTKESKEGAPDEFRVTSWTPMEVSFVDIPADPTVGVGRDDDGELAYRIIDLQPEQKAMKFDNDGNPIAETDEDRAALAAGTAKCKDGSLYVAPTQQREEPGTVIDLDAERKTAREAGRVEGQLAETQRREGINKLFKPFGDTHDKVRDAAINNDTSVDDTRELLLTALGKDSSPAGGEATRIEMGEDGQKRFERAAIITLAVRAGIATDDERTEANKTGLRGYTLFELARRSLEFANIQTSRLDKMTLVGRAFTTSDFPAILLDAANKSMLRGYAEAPETWQIWAQTGNLSDFKIGNRVNLSSFNDLVKVNEDGEYKYGSFTDEKQTIQLATFGKLFAISRQAIINDDLGAFTRIPGAMGRAASRVVGDLAYGALTSNPVLGDGIVVFIAAHNNLNESGAGGTPLTNDAAGVAALSAMDVAMGLQSDISGSATGLNITPAFLLVPKTLKRTAVSLMSDTTAPGQANPGVKNSIEGLAEVVADPRLDADSLTRYYLLGGKTFDTIEVAFLDGNQSPVLEQQMGWSIDGTEFKVRIDVAAAPMEFRTMQRDDGT